MHPGLSVAVYAKYNGMILLIFHKRLRQWLPVGGSVEPHETPFDAARRELREETGLDATWPTSPIRWSPPGFLAYTENEDPDKGLRMTLSFLAHVSSSEIRPNGEYSAYQWVKSPYRTGVVCPPNVEDILAKIAIVPSDHA